MNLRIAFVVVAAVSMGCTPKKIPGTDINDNDDTRSILDVIESYRRAVEKKDAQTIVALLDPAFRDDGGTSNADDDLEYATANAEISKRLAAADDIRLELNVRKIEFDQDMVKARAVYTWVSSFKIPALTSRPQSESEIKQMVFRRADKKKKGAWKIVSGI